MLILITFESKGGCCKVQKTLSVRLSCTFQKKREPHLSKYTDVNPPPILLTFYRKSYASRSEERVDMRPLPRVLG